MKLHEYFKLLVLTVALANASAADKGDGDLLKVLAKERKEMSNIFQQENAELRRDDQKLRERDEKLHDRIDRLNEQLVKLLGKNDKQAEQVTKMNQQVTKLHGKNDKLQDQNKKLKDEMMKLHKKLQRQSDKEVNHLQHRLEYDRQRDHQNQTSEFDQRIKQSIRQRDVHSELTKIIKNEIKHFLLSERICVNGEISGQSNTNSAVTTTHHVDLGYTFPRKPAFSVAISNYDFFLNRWADVKTTVTEVTNSSAEISVVQKDVVWSVSWMACL